MKEYFLHLLDYEHWANRIILNTLHLTNDPPERAVQLMGHILGAQAEWFNRVNGGTQSLAFWPVMPEADMEAVAQTQHSRWLAYVADTNTRQLDHPIRYQNSTGAAFENTLTDILTHLSHHAAYHRGQIVQLIGPQLAEAPVTDYIVWRRGKGRGTIPVL